MAHRRRPNADACADPGALPVADGAAGEVKHEVKEEERDDDREKNDFKDEVNDKDQTPRIETKEVKQEVAVIGAVPRRRSNIDGADPVLPAPSQRQARRPPRLPEDAPQFGDAKLLEDLEAEVKQNKKISTQSEIKQIV